MNQGKTLYQLQVVELRLRSHQQRIAEIDAQLQNDNAVQKAMAVVESAQKALNPVQTKQRDLELQIQSVQDKRQQTENRLYSGSVTNPKELQDMQQEMQSLKKRHDDLETSLLEVMDAVETAAAALQVAEDQLTSTQQQVASENKDALSEKEGLQSEVKQLESERHTLHAELTQENLQRYEKLKPQCHNRPMSRLVEDDMCEACGIQQLQTHAREIRQGKELLTCRNCRRLLVYMG